MLNVPKIYARSGGNRHISDTTCTFTTNIASANCSAQQVLHTLQIVPNPQTHVIALDKHNLIHTTHQDILDEIRFFQVLQNRTCNKCGFRDICR